MAAGMYVECCFCWSVIEISRACGLQSATVDDSSRGDTASHAAQDVVQSEVRSDCLPSVAAADDKPVSLHDD